MTAVPSVLTQNRLLRKGPYPLSLLMIEDEFNWKIEHGGTAKHGEIAKHGMTAIDTCCTS